MPLVRTNSYAMALIVYPAQLEANIYTDASCQNAATDAGSTESGMCTYSPALSAYFTLSRVSQEKPFQIAYGLECTSSCLSCKEYGIAQSGACVRLQNGLYGKATVTWVPKNSGGHRSMIYTIFLAVFAALLL